MNHESKCSCCGQLGGATLKLVGGPHQFVCEMCAQLMGDIVEHMAPERPPPLTAEVKALQSALTCGLCEKTVEQCGVMIATPNPQFFVCLTCAKRCADAFRNPSHH